MIEIKCKYLYKKKLMKKIILITKKIKIIINIKFLQKNI